MRTFKWILGLILLVNAHTVSAQNFESCNPCDPCELCLPNLNLTIYADYLYWKVSRGDLNYFVNDEDDIDYVNPDYDHGFRAGFSSTWNCWDLGARYTHYTNRKNKLDGKYEMNYKVVDIELGYSFNFSRNDFQLRPFTGAKLAWIDETYVQPNNDQVRDEMETEGYGIYLGSEFRYKMCEHSNGGIYLSARGSYGIIDTSFEIERGTSEDYPRDCLYVSYFDAFAGLDIRLCECRGVGANLLLGYEVQFWGDVREFDSQDDLMSLGLGGLVVRLGLSF